MKITLSKVISESDIESVAKLAQEIWHHHFTSIIGTHQVEYMLEKYQSPEAITAQIQKGWEYHIAEVKREPVGYIGLVPDEQSRKLMISKIYVRSTFRGRGAGTQMLVFIEQQCLERGFDKIWLTVNRFNHDAIHWYAHNGFDIVDKVKKDIGNGFFMDDFIFQKKL